MLDESATISSIPPNETSYLTLRARAMRLQSMMRDALAQGEPHAVKAKQKSDELISRLDNRTSESIELLRSELKLVEDEFITDYIYPDRKRRVLWMWTSVLLCITIVHLLIGEGTLLDWTHSQAYFPGLTGAARGHFQDYLPFRYILYGTLIGSAFIMTYNNLKVGVDDFNRTQSLLTAPVVNIIVSLAISYVFFLLVKQGQLSFNILGFKLDSNNMSGSAVFLTSFGISLAAEQYADRLLSKAQPSEGRA